MSLLTFAVIADVVLKATLVLGLAGLAAAALGRASAATRHLVWTLGVAAALLVPALRGAAPLGAAAAAATPTVVRLEPKAAPEPHSRSSARGANGVAPRRQAPPPHPRCSPPPRGSTRGRCWASSGSPARCSSRRPCSWARRASAAHTATPRRVLVAGFGPRCCATSRGRSRCSGRCACCGRAKTMPMAWGLLRPRGGAARGRRGLVGRAATRGAHPRARPRQAPRLPDPGPRAGGVRRLLVPPARLDRSLALRVERERACDDLVLRAGANGPDYADHLLQLARGARAGSGPAWALAMARPSQLEGRLLAILDPTLDRRGPTRAVAALAMGAAALMVVVLAGLEPWERPVSASTSLAFETLGADGIGSAARPAEDAAEQGAAGAVQPTPHPRRSDRRAASRRRPTASWPRTPRPCATPIPR